MRILIDTNIIIDREDNKIISKNLQRVLNILNRERVQILIHPLSKDEINRDKNLERKSISLSKLSTYPLLESPPNPFEDTNYLNLVGKTDNEHEIVDNHILFAVYKNAVDFVITEDRGIHKKASKLGIEERVFTLEDALTTLEKIFTKFPPRYPPAITETAVHSLDVKDKIFDSLKEEYDDFEDWFEKISKEGRKCWVNFNEDKSIGAVLIYKSENEPIGLESNVLEEKKRLKICTFKSIKPGYKIGELFLNLCIKYALKNKLKEVYLTHFIKGNDYLVELIREYGFLHVGRNINGEDVFLKNLEPKKSLLKNKFESKGPIEIAKKFYPHFYDGEEVKKFIVPIRPEYHHRLFVDYKRRQTTLSEFSGEFIIEGNAIKKAYICNSVRKLNPGDILFFYKSKDQELTTIGIVEKAFIDQQKDEVIKTVGKRTVYTTEEIGKITEKKRNLVILFIMISHLPNTLKLDDLITNNILKKARNL